METENRSCNCGKASLEWLLVKFVPNKTSTLHPDGTLFYKLFEPLRA